MTGRVRAATAALLLCACLPDAGEGARSGEQPKAAEAQAWVEQNGMGVQIVAPIEPLPVNGRLGLSIRYRGVPAGSGLAVALIPVPLNADVRGGSFSTAPLAVEGSGTLDVPWQGRLASAPTDVMDWYPAQPGRYRIDARIMNYRTDLPTMVQVPGQRELAHFRGPEVVLLPPR